MIGLVPAIHTFNLGLAKDVDARTRFILGPAGCRTRL